MTHIDNVTKKILVNGAPRDLHNTITLNNARGNNRFINWILKHLEAIKIAHLTPQQDIDIVIHQRLQKLLKTLCAYSSFWENEFETHGLLLDAKDSKNELKKLPVVDKSTIKKFGGKNLIRSAETNVSKYYTSGTTGVPLEVTINDSEALLHELAYIFEPEAFKHKPIREYLHKKFILLVGRNATGKYTPFSDYFPLDAYTQLNDLNARRKIYHKILSGDQVCIFGYASVLLELTKHAKEDMGTLPVILNPTGEGLSPEEEKFLYNITGICPTFSYTNKEAGRMGSKCFHNIGTNLYHIFTERVIVEIVDENDHNVKNDEEGDVVITALDRITMPVIRYKTGDRGTLLTTPCVCGKTSPLLALEGRKKDVLMLPNNGVFSILLFRSLLMKTVGIEYIHKYQIVQEDRHHVIIYFIPRKKILKEKILLSKIILEKALGGVLSVDFKEVTYIERYKSGKSKIFIPLNH